MSVIIMAYWDRTHEPEEYRKRRVTMVLRDKMNHDQIDQIFLDEFKPEEQSVQETEILNMENELSQLREQIESNQKQIDSNQRQLDEYYRSRVRPQEDLEKQRQELKAQYERISEYYNAKGHSEKSLLMLVGSVREELDEWIVKLEKLFPKEPTEKWKREHSQVQEEEKLDEIFGTLEGSVDVLKKVLEKFKKIRLFVEKIK